MSPPKRELRRLSAAVTACGLEVGLLWRGDMSSDTAGDSVPILQEALTGQLKLQSCMSTDSTLQADAESVQDACWRYRASS